MLIGRWFWFTKKLSRHGAKMNNMVFPSETESELIFEYVKNQNRLINGTD